MSLRRANITWSNNQISKMIRAEKVSFDNIVQRSYVWEQARKSLLIESMIIGYPVPPIYSKRGDDKVYDILDGKQRLLSIDGYLNDEYELKNLKTTTIYDVTGEKSEFDLNGLKYSELPEEVQETINAFNMTVYYYDDITEEEVRELFKRLNAGKPLSTKERNIANCTDIRNILKIGEHELFSDMFTPKALLAKKHVPVIIKAYVMLSTKIYAVSFESKKFNNLVSEVSISDEWKEKLEKVFDRYVKIHNDILDSKESDARSMAKRIYKETHFVSLIPFVADSIERESDEVCVVEWIWQFFEGSHDSQALEQYNEASLSGVAKPESIQRRYNALKQSYDVFFKIDD